MQSADELRRENEALRRRIARTRDDLETLIQSSPTGVAVFDARTGRPVSFNREAARIVGALGRPGEPPERVLETLTCRFADGRELAFARLPRSGPAGVAALRDEVIVLSVPDGRDVRTLVNAVPIRGDGGEVESVVVTLQDLGPIEKAERFQTELLDMVSRELRSPLTAIKGSTATVLGPPRLRLHRARRRLPHGRARRRGRRALSVAAGSSPSASIRHLGALHPLPAARIRPGGGGAKPTAAAPPPTTGREGDYRSPARGPPPSWRRQEGRRCPRVASDQVPTHDPAAAA